MVYIFSFMFTLLSETLSSVSVFKLMKSFGRHMYSCRTQFLGQMTAQKKQQPQLKGNHGSAAFYAYAKMQHSQPRTGEMEGAHGGCKELWAIPYSA